MWRGIIVGIAACALVYQFATPTITVNPTVNINLPAVRARMDMQLCRAAIEDWIESYPWMALLLIAAAYVQRIMCSNLLE